LTVSPQNPPSGATRGDNNNPPMAKVELRQFISSEEPSLRYFVSHP
jgi:hypothetical protein